MFKVNYNENVDRQSLHEGASRERLGFRLNSEQYSSQARRSVGSFRRRRSGCTCSAAAKRGGLHRAVF